MADGPGFRTSVYCAGCRHACRGCHNPQSWDFNAGKWMSVDELLEIIKADSMSNVSFSGGDPFYQVEAFTELARRIKEETNKTIWCWTGFTIEEIRADEHLAQMLEYLDNLEGEHAIQFTEEEFDAILPELMESYGYTDEPPEDVIPGTVPLVKLR